MIFTIKSTDDNTNQNTKSKSNPPTWFQMIQKVRHHQQMQNHHKSTKIKTKINHYKQK